MVLAEVSSQVIPYPLLVVLAEVSGFSHRQIRQLDNTHNGEVYLSSPSMILLIRIHVHGPQHEPSGAAK